MEKLFYIRLSDKKVQISGDTNAAFGNENGEVCAKWNWDGEKLIVTNDRYGFYPLYYITQKDEFLISPSVQSLLKAKPDFDLDEAAMAVFHRFGWLVGEDTIFRQIRALPPNCVLIWQNGKLKISVKPPKIYQTLNISRRDAIHTYAEFFQKAVEKNLPPDDDFIIPLSGGRDSRHIVLALAKANRNPAACVTLLHPPPRPNEDAKIAAQICQALKIKHHLIEPSSSRFANEYKKNEITGYATDEHGWFMPLAHFIKDKRATIYDGIAGDVLSAGLFLNEERLSLFQKGKFEELADKLLQPEGFIPALLTPDNHKNFNRERAVNHLTKELTRHADQPNPVGSFFFWNRTRRCVALSPFRLFDNSINVITPYLETKLFDFLFSLPAKMMLDHQFHTDTIAFAYPEYAHFPYEKKDSMPITDISNFRKFSRDILRYSLTGRNRKLTRRSFFLTRCLRCVLDKNYSRTITEFGEQAILLAQLERL